MPERKYGPYDGELEYGRPGHKALVMRFNPKTKQLASDQLEWGLLHHAEAHPESALRPIWARGETVASNPLFAGAFKHRRCIVPATEWYQTSAGLSPGARFGFSRNDGEPMAWGGLWESYTYPSGTILRSYCVITVDAGPDVSPYHGRQPLVLEKSDLAVWSSARDGNAATLLRPTADYTLHARMLADRGSFRA